MGMTLWKQTLQLRAFGLKSIPLLFIARPRITKLTPRDCEVVIPLNYITKNHLGCMYFGTLAMGADCAGGLMALQSIRKSGKKVDLLFKDFKADFLKRAEGDVHFVCKEGQAIQKQVEQALRTKQRVNRTLKITATTPRQTGKSPVAEFALTLSLKAR